MSSLRHGTNLRDKIRVFGLCDKAMFAVPHNFAKINYEPKNSVHGQRPYILFAPHNMLISKCVFSNVVVKLCRKGHMLTVLTKLCVFAAAQIYPRELHENEEKGYS